MTDKLDHSPIIEPQNEDIGKASLLLVIFLLIPLIGILATLLIFAIELRNPNTDDVSFESISSPSALLDSDAPYFELPNLEGNIVSVADFRGKILFLNFWQTTCPPCVRELPDFVNFIEENEDEATWLAINVDETPTIINTFFAKHDFIGIPVVMDRESTVRNQYGVMGFPMTFVLDEDGIIRHLSIGELSYPEMQAILESVRG